MNKKSLYKIMTIFIMIFALFSVAIFWVMSDSETSSSKQSMSLNEGWYYFNQSGDKINVTLPCKIEAADTLELYHNSTDTMTARSTLSTYGAVYDIEIYIGDTLLYQFEDNGREINNAVRGNLVCYGQIPKDYEGQPLRVVYHHTSGKCEIAKMALSTEKELVESVFLKSLFCLLVSVAMLIVGCLAIVFGWVMKMQKVQDNRIFCIGLFLVFGGAWCLSDSAFIQMLLDYNELIFNLDFYLFMLMPIPLAYFVLYTNDMKQYKVLKMVPILYYINIIVQSLLAAFCGVTFFRMLYATHVLMMFSGVLCSLHVLVIAYRRQKRSDTLLSIQALASVGLLGTFAIFLYIFFDYSTYQVVYQTGLLLLMTVLLSALLKEFMQSVRNRTEAIVYKQLSEQDKLTKLDNRRSFDALMEKMESGDLQYTNAALLFMDVNFLKKANDTYDHEFGDTLLIGAATCIKNAFGNAGYCYRIGGDEFCAVILDPSHPAEELLDYIRIEINQFNKDNALKMNLSIATGCSFIEENGERKTLTEWKLEADNRMYADKKRIKAQREA